MLFTFALNPAWPPPLMLLSLLCDEHISDGAMKTHENSWPGLEGNTCICMSMCICICVYKMHERAQIHITGWEAGGLPGNSRVYVAPLRCPHWFGFDCIGLDWRGLLGLTSIT